MGSDLYGYGLPLPGRTGSLGNRAPKIPGIIAASRGNRPRPQRVDFQNIVTPKQAFIPRDVNRQNIRVSSPRDILSIIAENAKSQKRVIIRYQKVSTGEVVDREIEPYSLRLKMTKNGRVRYLYGFHVDHGKIESYRVDNIESVAPTTATFLPRWVIEF
jgi:hypothetical protein